MTTKRLHFTLGFGAALVAAALLSAPAAAQTACDENVRQQFLEDVEAGASEAELEDAYGHCRENLEEPTCTESDDGTTTSGVTLGERFKTISNNGSIFYERLNGCGYHPQAETLACDVELRQNFGYGGFPGGSDEHVLYCMDCNRDGAWDYVTLGSVHVTDNVSGVAPPFFFNTTATTWAAPPGSNCVRNNGTAITVKAVLSWVWRPNTVNLSHCTNFRPFWGNTIFFRARNDP